MSNKIAIGVVVSLVVGSLLLCCVGFIVLGALAPQGPPSGGPAPAPDASSLEAAPADPGPDAKVLRLAPPAGARTEDVITCVAILNRRFTRAKIAGRAKLDGGKVVVSLGREPGNLLRAGKLLAAGGHLQFLELITTARMPAEEIAKEAARIAAAKAAKTFDPAKETYDVLATETDDAKGALVVLAGGVEGHLVATASPRQDGAAWVIDFTMSPEGCDAFEAFSKRLLEKQFAVVLDDTIKMVFWSRGVIREAGVMFRDNPGFTEDEALAITALMSSGRLPIELTMEED